MKVITLVTSTNTRPERNILKKMEQEDQHPRATLFADALNSDILDLRFLRGSKR